MGRNNGTLCILAVSSGLQWTPVDTSGHQYFPGSVVATNMLLGGNQLVLSPYVVF